MPRPSRAHIELAAVTVLGGFSVMCMGMLVASRMTSDNKGQVKRRFSLRGTDIHDFLTGRSQQDKEKDGDTKPSKNEARQRKDDT
jgi:hypothetical protein